MIPATRVWWVRLSTLLYFTALTIVLLWPVASDLDSTVAGWEGDNLFCIRQMWWVEHAIVDLRSFPFFDPTAYYPDGYNVAHGPILAANTVLGLPFTWAFGPVVSYNLMILLSFVLTGFGVSLWVGRLTGSRSAGIVAGTIAAFLPYRFAHVVGHMHMMTTQWIAFAFYAFERFKDRPSRGEGLLLGAILALVALSDWYYAYASALILPLYALARTRPWREFWTRADVWRGAAFAAAVAAALVLPFLLPYLRLASEESIGRRLMDFEFWALNFYDFFTLSRLHPVWGGAMVQWFPRQSSLFVEMNVMLGFAAIGLALIAVVLRRRHPAIAALLVVWMASYLIALGPTLHSGDRQVMLSMPLIVVKAVDRVLSVSPSLADARAAIVSAQALPIPLPSLFLYLLVPGTTGMRVMARFGVWTGLATAALAGFGIALTLEWLRRRGYASGVRHATVVAATVLVLFESWSAFPTMRVEPRPVDRWLARQPAHTAVIELPLDQASRNFQDYYQTAHGRFSVFGPNFTYKPKVRSDREAILAAFPSPSSIDALRAWKTTYVLFTPALIPAWSQLRAALQETDGLHYEGMIGDVWVYRVR
jgi:hypothetical protein